MCGIIGFSGPDNFDYKKIELLALCNSYERGGDATGFYTPKQGIRKDNVEAHNFLLNSKFQLESSNLLIGHLRKKSIGANTTKNAHPFNYNKLIGCHNGTINNYMGLANMYNIKHKNYDTDSQVLFQALSKEFTDGQYPDVFESYDGAAAVLFTLENSNELYAYRDNERPLYYGFSDKNMYISSLEYALKYIDCVDIKQFTKDVLYKIVNGEIVSEVKPKEKPKSPVTIHYTTTTNTNKVDYNYLKIAKDTDISVFEYIDHHSRKTKNILSFIGGNTFTGILRADIKGEMLMGYVVRNVGFTARPKDNKFSTIKMAAVTKNKYYHVIGWFGVNKEYVQIMDDNNQAGALAINNIDTANFIPTPGKFVKLMSSVYTTDEKEDLVGMKDDIFLVKSHNWTDKNIKVHSFYDDRDYLIPTRLCRTLTEDEYNNSKSFIKALVEKLDEKEDNQFTNQTNKEITEDNFKVEHTNEDEPLLNEDLNELDANTVINFVFDLDNRINDIILKYKKGIDITEEIDDMANLIGQAYDLNYLCELITK